MSKLYIGHGAKLWLLSDKPMVKPIKEHVDAFYEARKSAENPIHMLEVGSIFVSGCGNTYVVLIKNDIKHAQEVYNPNCCYELTSSEWCQAKILFKREV